MIDKYIYTPYLGVGTIIEAADHVLLVIFLTDQRVESVGELQVVLGLVAVFTWGSQLGITYTVTL